MARDEADQILGIFITVERFWKPSLINVVLPVLLVWMLGMAIFFIGAPPPPAPGAGRGSESCGRQCWHGRSSTPLTPGAFRLPASHAQTSPGWTSGWRWWWPSSWR